MGTLLESGRKNISVYKPQLEPHKQRDQIFQSDYFVVNLGKIQVRFLFHYNFTSNRPIKVQNVGIQTTIKISINET